MPVLDPEFKAPQMRQINAVTLPKPEPVTVPQQGTADEGYWSNLWEGIKGVGGIFTGKANPYRVDNEVDANTPVGIRQADGSLLLDTPAAADGRVTNAAHNVQLASMGVPFAGTLLNAGATGSNIARGNVGEAINSATNLIVPGAARMAGTGLRTAAAARPGITGAAGRFVGNTLAHVPMNRLDRSAYRGLGSAMQFGSRAVNAGAKAIGMPAVAAGARNIGQRFAGSGVGALLSKVPGVAPATNAVKGVTKAVLPIAAYGAGGYAADSVIPGSGNLINAAFTHSNPVTSTLADVLLRPGYKPDEVDEGGWKLQGPSTPVLTHALDQDRMERILQADPRFAEHFKDMPPEHARLLIRELLAKAKAQEDGRPDILDSLR